MVLVPNDNKALQIGSENQRKFSSCFKAYYQPHTWQNAGSTAPELGYELASLSSDAYMEYCKWDNQDTVKITGTFDSVKKIDALILGNPSWNAISGAFYKDGEVVFRLSNLFWVKENGSYITSMNGKIVFGFSADHKTELRRRLAPGETELDITDQKIIIIPLYIEADSFELLFDGPGSLHKLYLGLELTLDAPRALSYGYEGNAQGGITDLGVVYGITRPPTRKLSAAWDLWTDTERRKIERYINTVQTVIPHYIAPVKENYYIPPMFAALETDKLGNKKRAQSWHWEGVDLTWIEVN